VTGGANAAVFFAADVVGAGSGSRSGSKRIIVLGDATNAEPVTLILRGFASVEGIAPARLVREAALLLIEDDERFRAGVRKGIEQAEQGDVCRRV